LVVVGFGDMVKSADVIVAPTEVDVVAPVTEVDGPGVGAADAFVVFEITLLLLVVAAATGAPVTERGTLFTTVLAATFAVLEHAVTTEWVGVVVEYVGEPVPTTVLT